VVESALRAAVFQRLGASRFGLWFGDGVRFGLSGDGNALEVRVPDGYFREWIQRHYVNSLLEAAEEVTGRPLRVSIQVRDEAEPPMGDVVEPAPPGGEPDEQPHHRHTVTIPMPGNPKAPLVFPTPSPSGPDPGPPPPPSRPFPRGGRGTLDLALDSSLRSSEGSPPGSGPWPSGLVPGQAVPATNPVIPSPLGSTSSKAPSTSSRPLRRLEDFVTGPGNRLAYAAAREMAQSAGAAFNPLLIHSAVGLGKSHLLEGIGRAIRQAQPGRNVVQLTAEAFTNSFLEAMRTGSLSSFRARYRGTGGLIVDDVHFLAAKRATQDEFLHTFNALLDRGAPIVLSADQHPRLIARLTDELVTRFLGGMVVKIEPPDLATRRAILQAKAAARGVNVPEAVVGYIAEHLRASIRELEGALQSVIAQAVLTGRRLDLNLARAALRETIRHTAQAVALRDVERAVCQLFGVDSDALKSDSRARALAYPRMLAMHLARKHTGAAFSEIGRYFGGRNHSTVISADKKVQGWLRDEERASLLPGFETIADLLADLERSLGA
jgi:chromosomal replication initiator protein